MPVTGILGGHRVFRIIRHSSGEIRDFGKRADYSMIRKDWRLATPNGAGKKSRLSRYGQQKFPKLAREP
jgi:hypothetical protein